LIHRPDAGRKAFIPIPQRLVKISAGERSGEVPGGAAELFRVGKKRREANDIVSPEDAFELWQIAFRNERLVLAFGLERIGADGDVEARLRGRQYQVGAQGPQLA